MKYFPSLPASLVGYYLDLSQIWSESFFLADLTVLANFAQTNRKE